MRLLTAIAACGAIFGVCAAINVQVPLYAHYAAADGRGAGAVTLMFGVYVLTMVPTLLLLGGLSDRLGRRPVAAAGLVAAVAATAVVWAAPGFAALVVARALHGVAAGLTLGTATAWLEETLPGRGRASSLSAAALSMGFGTSPAATSLATWQGPVDRPWTYPALLAVLAGCLVAAALARDTGRDGSARLVRPPAFPRGTLAGGLVVATAWAVVGLLLAVVPRTLDVVGGADLARWSGIVLLLVNLSGTLVQLSIVGRVGERAMLLAGLAALPVVYAALVTGSTWPSVPLLLAAAVGLGVLVNGLLYVGSLGRVQRLAGGEQARAVGGYYLLAYVGLSVPAVGVGFLSGLVGDAPALWAFGGAVLLACLALLARLVADPAADARAERLTPATQRP